jgi:hypothetical protein
MASAPWSRVSLFITFRRSRGLRQASAHGDDRNDQGDKPNAINTIVTSVCSFTHALTRSTG